MGAVLRILFLSRFSLAGRVYDTRKPPRSNAVRWGAAVLRAIGPVSRVLSWTAIYLGGTVAGPLHATSSETVGQTSVSSTVLLRIEFTAPDCSQPVRELLPHVSTLTSSMQAPYPSLPRKRESSLISPHLLSQTRALRTSVFGPGLTGRYLSVALFLKSPSAGVTRYPCPVEPGLSSRKRRWAQPRGCPARLRTVFYPIRAGKSNDSCSAGEIICAISGKIPCNSRPPVVY